MSVVFCDSNVNIRIVELIYSITTTTVGCSQLVCSKITPFDYSVMMHYSVKRGLAIACRLSVCLGIAQTISPTPSLFLA